MTCENCKHCEKEGLLILPLRYGVICAPHDALKFVPDVPGRLGQHVTDLKIHQAKYGLRLSRQGYIYVLTEREGIRSWQGYFVLEQGQLSRFPVDVPPSIAPTPACNRSGTKMHAYMINIENAEDVQNAWMLFSPAVMTLDKLDEYRDNAEAFTANGKMQHFNPMNWIHGCHTQPHCVESDDMLTNVAEYLLFLRGESSLSSDLGLAMKDQMWGVHDIAFQGGPDIAGTDGFFNGVLGGIHRDLKQSEGAAIALFDHIGILQELNDYRNDALLPIDQFLKKTDAYHYSNERKLTVSLAIDDVKDSLNKMKIGEIEGELTAAKQKREEINDILSRPRSGGNSRWLSRKKQEMAGVDKRIARLEQELQRIKTDGYELWGEKYARYLNNKEITRFKTTFEQLSDDCGQKANARALDHRIWAMSDRLVDAFDMFDEFDLNSNMAFTDQYIRGTRGMFGLEINRKDLPLYFKIDKIERNNLYMRSCFYNRQELEDEAAKTFRGVIAQVNSAGDIAEVDPAFFATTAKGLVGMVKKMDSAWDEWLRDGEIEHFHQTKHETGEGSFSDKFKDKASKRLQMKYRNLSQISGVFATGPAWIGRVSEWSMVITIKPNPFDKVIQAVVGTMLYSRLGDIAERTLINDLLHNPKLAADPDSVESAKRLAKRQRRNKYDPAIRDSVENVRQQEHNRKIQKDLKGFFQDVETGREGSRPTTNNFRQARLGAALLAIESFGFALKLNPSKPWGAREYAEAAASLMMITSTAIDINYALCKSIREVEPYFDTKKGVQAKEGVPGRIAKSADIHRGALKAASGMLSSAAGVIAGALDVASLMHEYRKDNKDWVLISTYTLRAGYSFAGAYAGFMATVSYAGPTLAYLFANHPRLAASRVGIWLGSQGVKATGTAAAKAIVNAKLARTLWLVRIARFNAVGLVLTAIELIYVLAIKDDPMENWCQACTFRQYKSKSRSLEAPFTDIGTELDELETAFKAIVQ